jgi:hypothetical protein
MTLSPTHPTIVACGEPYSCVSEEEVRQVDEEIDALNARKDVLERELTQSPSNAMLRREYVNLVRRLIHQVATNEAKRSALDGSPKFTRVEVIHLLPLLAHGEASRRPFPYVSRLPYPLTDAQINGFLDALAAKPRSSSWLIKCAVAAACVASALFFVMKKLELI